MTTAQNPLVTQMIFDHHNVTVIFPNDKAELAKIIQQLTLMLNSPAGSLDVELGGRDENEAPTNILFTVQE